MVHTIKDEHGNDFITQQPTPVENVVYSLTYIVLAFIGPYPEILDRRKELLLNLRCPTLTHFRWYKDTFLSKVMSRTDANADFWKKKKKYCGFTNSFCPKG